MTQAAKRTKSLLRRVTARAALAVVISLVLAWGSVTLVDTSSSTKVPGGEDAMSLAGRRERLQNRAERKCRRLERRFPEREESSFRVTVGYPPRTFNCDEL